MLRLQDVVASADASPLAPWLDRAPWWLTAHVAEIVAQLQRALDGAFRVTDGIAVHADATLEPGATIKPPAIIGPDCRIAAGAYLRGGVWLQGACMTARASAPTPS